MGIRDFLASMFGTSAKYPPRRQYSGAAGGRTMMDWIAGSTSQDAETRQSLRSLRNRTRDLARNNDYVVNALRAIQSNIVGTGVSMQSQVKRGRGPGAGALDTAVNDEIEAAWKEWGKARNCHTAGVLAFNEIERLAVRSVAESGDVFLRLIRQPFGTSRIPLALELIEADRCDDQFTGRYGVNEVRMGVEVDSWQRPVAYWFLTRHPGDTEFNGTRQERVRIPAEEIIHLYRSDRPGQTRGVPWFSSALTRLRHMSGYEEAEVIAARASACQMGFITSAEPEFEREKSDDPAAPPITEFAPGKIVRLGDGEKFDGYNPTRPSGLLDPFMRYMLRGVASGVGVSYSTISHDYSQSNYSSSRLELLQDRDTWRQLQGWLIEALHRRVFEKWLEMAVLSGTLNLPRYELDPQRYLAQRWIPRGWNWIDPAREAAAYKLAVRSGFMTLADVVTQNGGDFDDLAHARQREIDLCNELGLVFDTDPSQVTDQGQAQPEPSADQLAEKLSEAA